MKWVLKQAWFSRHLFALASSGLMLSFGMSLNAGASQQPSPDSFCKVPYTATQWTTSTSPMPDGTLTSITNELDWAQSSSGQVRTVVYSGSPGTERKLGQPIIRTIITDRKKGLEIELFPVTRRYDTAPIPKAAPAGSKAPGLPAMPTMSTTHLGTRQMDGITVSGERTSYTMNTPDRNSGAMHPVTYTAETWSNQQMCLTMKVDNHSSDNDSGATEMTNVRQVEPPPSLFEIPSGYTKLNP